MPVIMNICENCSSLNELHEVIKCMLFTKTPVFHILTNYLENIKGVVSFDIVDAHTISIWESQGNYASNSFIIVSEDLSMYMPRCDNFTKKFAVIIQRLFFLAFDDSLLSTDRLFSASIIGNKLVLVYLSSDNHQRWCWVDVNRYLNSDFTIKLDSCENADIIDDISMD